MKGVSHVDRDRFLQVVARAAWVTYLLVGTLGLVRGRDDRTLGRAPKVIGSPETITAPPRAAAIVASAC